MEPNEQLFVGAPEGVILSGHFVLGEGWTLRLQVRRQYERWEDARAEVYDHISTTELEQVLEELTASMRAHLGL